MSEQKDCKFYVIQLLEPPYTDPEKYVCVPNSWIRLRETADGVAIVKFPIEELSKAKKRAKNKEFSDDWTIFLADIKYGTNSYKDGSHYIKTLNKISVLEQNSMEVIEDVPSTSDKNVLELQSSAETNKVRLSSILNSDAEPVSKKMTKQLDLTNTEAEVCQEKIKVETVDSSTKARRYMTRQSLRMSLSTNKTVSLLNQTAEKNRPDTSNCIEESEASNDNQEDESSVKSYPELPKKRSIQVILRSVLGDDFREVLQRLHNDNERSHLMIINMLLEVKTNCKIIDKLIEQADAVSDDPDISDISSTVEKSENSMMEVDICERHLDEVTKSKVQNDVQNEDDKKHNSDGTEVKNNHSLNKIRGQSRKFTLPPEYDPKDSRWTLKHRECKNGLIELIPHSRVYIDSIQLSKCKRMSKDSKTLARMLLLEIFSKNALSICSLTGKKANAFDIEGTRVRPGLDKHARTVLLNYVEKHAVEKKWVKFDTRMISNTLRNKVQEVRGKYG